MSRLFTLCIMLTLSMSLQAQYYYNGPPVTPGGNPGNINQSWEEPYGGGLDPAWVSIQPASHPAWTADQTLPFTFYFNGQPVTQYKVSTTGVLTFTTSATTVPASKDVLPSPMIPDKSICIWGMAWSGTGSNDHIVKRTFGVAPMRQHWVQFNSYNIQGGNNDCWTYWSIVLEESTNKIYIVDQRNPSQWGPGSANNCKPMFSLGVQVNSTTATMVANSPNVACLAGTSKTGSDNKYYEFLFGSPPNYDMTVNFIQTSNFLGYNSKPYEIRGTVKNLGNQAVTSYKVNYQIDTGAIKTMNVTGVNIPKFGEAWYIHTTLWNPDTTGDFDLKVWCSEINGNADQNTYNDTATKLLTVMGVFVPKIILHEVFTSSSCLPCKDGNTVLKSVLDSIPGQYSIIKYQMNYPSPGDPYYSPEADGRRTMYQVDSLPALVLDGSVQLDPNFYDQAKFLEQTKPSYMTFNATRNNISSGYITVTSTFIPFQPFTSPNLKVFFAVVEKVTHNNATTNGETSFNYVFRKFIPDANGIAIGPFQQGIPITKTATYTFPTPNNIEAYGNLDVAVFLQDMQTKEILQAGWAIPPSGIENPSVANILKLFPNPASQDFTLRYRVTENAPASVEIYDIRGSLMMRSSEIPSQPGQHEVNISTSNLSSGAYIVVLKAGNTNSIERLMITR